MLCAGMYAEKKLPLLILIHGEGLFVRYFNNSVLCIKRVKFPQIDFFHGNPPISIFEWVDEQIEIRGAVIYTVQVQRQACPAPYM